MRTESCHGSTNEDVWINTVCGMCYGGCAIRAHRVNGTVIKLEGDPETSQGYGRICAKGVAGLQNLYDPNRVNVPLKRTNPEKGIGVDPKWKPVSWDEAMDNLADKLGKVIADDPRKLLFQGTTIHGTHVAYGLLPFLRAFGSPNYWVSGGGVHCGAGAHLLAGMNHASWDVVPDWDNCNYVLSFGASHGHAAGHSAMLSMLLAANARERGMKLVAFDPMANFVGGKATEWVPILPGTDSIVILAMLNVILNDLKIFDRAFLKSKTNGPYLVREDRLLLRDANTGRPMIWDVVDDRPRAIDDPDLKDYALEGEYRLDGQRIKTAFQLLTEHLRQFAPEQAEQVSTAPADTIRRIAREFVEAARVGSTIRIQDKELPYRPAAACVFRGAQGHTNAVHTCMSVTLLNQVVGNMEAVGGAIGWPARSLGYPGGGGFRFEPCADEDGMLVPGRWFTRGMHSPSCQKPEVKVPIEEIGMRSVFPLMNQPTTPGCLDSEEVWQKLGLPYRIEAVINYGCNSIMSFATPEGVAKNFKRIPFVVSFDIFVTEFAECFADLVLPDTSYLEQLTLEGVVPIYNLPYGMHDWAWHLRQPVASPSHQRRQCVEVLIELSHRLGIYEKFIDSANYLLYLEGPYTLDPKKSYSWASICDAHLKSQFGPDRDLEWFKQNGGLKWKKKVEEVYWRSFLDIRVPIYYEMFLKLGADIRQAIEPRGIKVQWEQYAPLPGWFPCPPHSEPDKELDLYAFSYRDIIHTGTWTMQLPYLDEASRMNPYTYNIGMNADMAASKRLQDGDAVWVENRGGRRIKGQIKLLQGIHPSCLAIAACSGHWSRGMPIARGKGSHFNEVLEADQKHIDPMVQGIETAVRVQIYKA